MTRVAELALIHARIGLHKQVRHASATREMSDNLVVRATLENGVVGFGEGVPRSYVTGETIDGAIEQLRQTGFSSQLEPARSFEHAVSMIAALELWQPRPDPRGCYGNAARCAVELSLLDAFGKHFRVPLSTVTQLVPEAAPIRESAEWVRYSGAITVESEGKELWSAIKMRLYGFRDCKVKVGVNGQSDRERMGHIRRILGRRVRVRIDANEAWRPDEVVDRVRELEPFGIAAVEQPVPHERVAELAEVRLQVKVPIMHDESLCSLADAREAIEQGTCDMFNIRLSKCGGFVNSLRIAALAQANGLGYQLGCQVGETGILSAAGRHFATSVADIRFLEGSYDRHLVTERLTQEDVTFGYGGRAPALHGFGLGVSIDEQALARVTQREERIRLG
ncbi:MAG: dipeptide epimerase [Planctomycetes bacterium]|nr:dipeptide epimerase [Planctomycetota bacterium]